MRVVATRQYDRRARKLLTAEERARAEVEIAAAPEAWPVIPGTGGARKARAARGGKGKSGGARIIYYFWLGEQLIYLIDVYAKSEKEDLTHAEKKEIRDFLAQAAPKKA
ncbi:MAG: type II toxin-antitoxin system RelE/ParE family toxin [Rhodospirillales bacterium]|nr:type II toxin-antitoxin system RelE/ParE family toxin [Rhodospirillales bacterium]